MPKVPCAIFCVDCLEAHSEQDEQPRDSIDLDQVLSCLVLLTLGIILTVSFSFKGQPGQSDLIQVCINTT